MTERGRNSKKKRTKKKRPKKSILYSVKTVYYRVGKQRIQRVHRVGWPVIPCVIQIKWPLQMQTLDGSTQFRHLVGLIKEQHMNIFNGSNYVNIDHFNLGFNKKNIFVGIDEEALNPLNDYPAVSGMSALYFIVVSSLFTHLYISIAKVFDHTFFNKRSEVCSSVHASV
eukprot:818561_1